MSFSEWREQKLGDLCTVKGGKRLPKGRNLTTNKTNHPYIRIRDMYQHKYIEENGELEYVDDQTFELIKRYIVDSGDIILAIVGNTIGLVSLIGKSLNKASLTENCVKLIDLKSVKPEFIYYYLITEAGQNEIKSKIVGTSQPKLPIYGVQDIKIPVPPLNEQDEIVSTLSSLDDKIEVNNQINKTLENMAQAIFKQWFVDFEFPNEDGEPYKSSGGEMVETELGMIPKGWEVGNLAESKLTNLVKTGITEFSGEKIYLATADVDKSNILSNTTKVTYNERPSRANMQPKENTVWFAKMKDSRKLIRVSRGSKDLIENYIFSTGFAGINVKEGLNYIWSFICSNDFDIRKNNLCHGTTMQAINNSNISNIPLLLPNEEILKKYEDITDYLFESEYLRKKENEKLAKIRDTLLPKLMSGKIRVPLDSEGDVS